MFLELREKKEKTLELSSENFLSASATMNLLVWILVVVVIRLEACERSEQSIWTADFHCFMNVSTTIRAVNFTLTEAENLTVSSLYFDFNQNIEFLPVDIELSFPRLFTLSAINCSLREIFPENFRNLKELRFLYLQENHIKSISNDCFELLTNLKRLNLGKAH